MDMYPVNKILAGCQAAIASRLAPTVWSKYNRERQVGYKAASRASFAPTGDWGDGTDISASTKQKWERACSRWRSVSRHQGQL